MVLDIHARRKKKAYKKFRASRNNKYKTRFDRLKQEMQRVTRQAFNNYVMAILDPATDINATDYIRTSSRRRETVTASVLCGAPMARRTRPQVGRRTSSTTNSPPSSLLRAKMIMSELEPAPFEAMPGIDIHVNGVAKLLRGIKAHKATGPNAIPARLLKEAADQLAPILTSIYRASLQQATVPEEWKKANVVPIFKKGDLSAASSYRPVSLTSIASKVMEHGISSQVMRHLDINDVLHDAQHGFRKRRSCETQLLLSADDFLKTLDKNVQTDAILLDFSKAFDTQTSNEEAGSNRSDRHYPRMDLILPHRSRTDGCLGRNVIRRQASHIRSAPGYCPWPASISYIYQ